MQGCRMRIQKAHASRGTGPRPDWGTGAANASPLRHQPQKQHAFATFEARSQERGAASQPRNGLIKHDVASIQQHPHLELPFNHIYACMASTLSP